MMLLQIQDAMPNEALTTFTAASMVVSIIQWLKQATWIPFVSQHSAGINRAISWGAAIVTGTGIHWMYSTENGTLLISGLTVASVSSTVLNTIQSYFAQWLVYNAAIKARAADVAAVAHRTGAPPIPVAQPGVIEAGEHQADEGGK